MDELTAPAPPRLQPTIDGGFRTIEAPIVPNPDLRRRMIGLGGRISLAMEIKNIMPEDVARDTGMSTKVIDQVRCGSEVDIGIRALAAICDAVGCGLTIGITQPVIPPQHTS